MEILFLIGRILFGGYFIINGFNHLTKSQMMSGYAASKGVPAAGLAIIVTGLMILLGGLGILLGVYIRLAVLLLVIFLIAVGFKMHDFWNVADPQQRMTQMLSFTRNLALSGAALMFLGIPEPWIFSLF